VNDEYCEVCDRPAAVAPYRGRTLCWKHFFEYAEYVMEMDEWIDLVELVEEALGDNQPHP